MAVRMGMGSSRGVGSLLVGRGRRALCGRVMGRNWDTAYRSRRELLTQSHAVGPTEVSNSPPLPFSLSPPQPILTSGSQPPLLTYTIPEHFATIVAQHGDRPAVIARAQDTRLSYRELDERSNAVALGLRSRGVRKGDRVAVSLGNCWEFAVVTYALFKLGAILVCPCPFSSELNGC